MLNSFKFNIVRSFLALCLVAVFSTGVYGIVSASNNGISPVSGPISGPIGSTVKIYAAGTSVGGVYPIMVLAKDGQYVNHWGNITIDPVTGYKEYTYTFPFRVSASQIGIAFTNDEYNPATGEDRNLAVDKINLDGVDYQTEAQSTYSVGSWVAGQGSCEPGFAKSEVLLCNGYFAYGQ